nr:3-dehydroquinate synthase family protein [Anaerolinea sp.]
WVGLPTTLLSMADASLGGKTGADLPQGKNLVGAFHPPALVLADPNLLATLPEAEQRSGMAEVVKHGLLADESLFRRCKSGWQAVQLAWPEVVRRAMAVKIGFIQADPYEKGARAALNLGHTVGHAVELASGFRLRHGEAVAIGLVVEARLGERLGVTQPGLAERIAACLRGLGLPVEVPEGINADAFLRALKVDKKNAAGQVRFALPERIGAYRVGVSVEMDFRELLAGRVRPAG